MGKPAANAERNYMKHVIKSDAWQFSMEPFPAYRASLVYGRNKRDREFLPVNGILPETKWKINKYDSNPDQKTFETREEAEAECRAQNMHTDWITSESFPLPENRFRIIKTKEKGTLMVIGGEDTTNRVLLFCGVKEGFRGGSDVLECTGQELKRCSAGNACEGQLEVIVLLEAGQHVALHSWGRRTDEVLQFAWDGVNVSVKTFSKAEWDSRLSGTTPEGDVI